MKRKPILWLYLMTLLVFVTLTACNAGVLHTSAPIRIKDPWLRRAPETETGELYMYIANHSDVDDALVAARSEAATGVEMYAVPAGEPASALARVSRIELPVNTGLLLIPGGPHLELVGLREAAAGQLVPIVLEFERAGEFAFYVEAH